MSEFDLLGGAARGMGVQRALLDLAARNVAAAQASSPDHPYAKLVADVVARMKEAGMTMPVVVGGIIPPDDAAELKLTGVAAVYTPKDFELNRMMSDVLRIVERSKVAG